MRDDSSIPLHEKIRSVRYRDGRSLADRFWSYTHVAGDDECWLWNGYRSDNGYGKLGCYVGMDDSGRPITRLMLVHRVSWRLHFGDIPPKMHVLHRCDNPPCVNPRHLFLGTSRDNFHDMVSKGRAAFQKPGWTPAPMSEAGRERLREFNRHSIGFGEKNPNASLTEDVVRDIRRLREEGMSLRKLGAHFGIPFTTIHSIVKRKTWKHV